MAGGTGGTGGGGIGGNNGAPGGNASGYGSGGGGGGGHSTPAAGGQGSDGIIVIRYLTPTVSHLVAPISATYTVKRIVQRLFSTSYRIKKNIQNLITVTYRIKKITQIPIGVNYKIKKINQKTSSANYHVKTKLQNTATVNYKVKTIIPLSGIDLKYQVAIFNTISVYVLTNYKIKMIKSIQESVNYIVRLRTQITESVNYEVLLKPQITENVSYQVIPFYSYLPGSLFNRSSFNRMFFNYRQLIKRLNIQLSMSYSVPSIHDTHTHVNYLVATVIHTSEGVDYWVKQLTVLRKFVTADYDVKSVRQTTIPLSYRLTYTPSVLGTQPKFNRTFFNRSSEGIRYLNSNNILIGIRYGVFSQHGLSTNVNYRVPAIPVQTTQPVNYMVKTIHQTEREMRYRVFTYPRITEGFDYTIFTIHQKLISVNYLLPADIPPVIPYSGVCKYLECKLDYPKIVAIHCRLDHPKTVYLTCRLKCS
jgi:hypothetical protein